VVGFAARQTLGNMVAGVSLAIAQPLKIGDRVSFEDKIGRVDDITLTYTYIDPGDGSLVVIPNESIVSGMLINHSTGDRTAPVTVSAWVPPDTEFERAERVLKEAGADTVHLAEWTAEGIRLEIKVGTERDRTRVGDEETALRERAQTALQNAGLLAGEPPSGGT
jgi:small-conductance mechanosensitive channel